MSKSDEDTSIEEEEEQQELFADEREMIASNIVEMEREEARQEEEILQAEIAMIAAAEHEEEANAVPVDMPDPGPEEAVDAQTQTCAICYEKLFDRNVGVITLCGHAFHMVCINANLNFSNKCPLCNEIIRDVVRVYIG